MDKIKVFETELKWIQNPEIRNFAEKAVSLLPDYFFEVAASSTGKYHPTYAIGPGDWCGIQKLQLQLLTNCFHLKCMINILQMKEI